MPDHPLDTGPPSRSSLTGLNPVGLLDAVIDGDYGDWLPPPAEVLEPWFHGFDNFAFIDRGGMGAVYLARQKSLDRRVAIKILPPELGHDTGFVERFHQEARLLAKLQHPHIVTIYDFGATQAGHLFIVMEYVQGVSLLEEMRKERLKAVRCLEIVSQVCDALQFAHDRGIIHRDIKPTNILLDERGLVRVADFGLAKLTGAEPASKTSTHSRSGKGIGTPGYTAPEQRRGEPDLDHRADIFSLGITLYEMLTGHLPVGVFESPSRKIGSPPALDRVIVRCLQERPALRYQTAAQMQKAIAPIAEKLGAPSFQKQILQRPITAAVIVIQLFVVSWLLYDKVARKEPVKFPELSVTSEPPQFILLNPHYALLPETRSWNRARDLLDQKNGYRLAHVEDAADHREIIKLLADRGIRVPVWLGAYCAKDSTEFHWTDGRPVTFNDAWMPEHTEPAVIITEIQAKNTQTARTAAGEIPPGWVELYNPGKTAVDLKDWHFLEFTPIGASEGWLKPRPGVSTVIGPESRRLVYFGVTDLDTQELSLPFNLDPKGAMFRWTDPRGKIVQIFNSPWPEFPPDVSIGCDESGGDWGVCEEPTPGQPNKKRISSIPPPANATPVNLGILMLPDAGGRWTMEFANRKAWVLLEKIR